LSLGYIILTVTVVTLKTKGSRLKLLDFSPHSKDPQALDAFHFKRNVGTVEEPAWVYDLLQEDASTLYECSGDSNEASFTVWIPANKFEVPINFRILPE